MLSEFFAGFSGVFGGRSGKVEDRLSELYEIAIDKLRRTTKLKGANALLGFKLDIDEISGKNMFMLMINVYGTAVLANKIIYKLMKKIAYLVKILKIEL